MKSLATALTITLLILLPREVSAQWTPLVAKQRLVTEQVNPDGSLTVLSETRGDYLRTSSGKVLATERQVVNGQEGPEEGAVFEDRALGKVYQLIYRLRKANLRVSARPTIPASSDEERRRAKAHSIGEQAVNGVDCLAFHVVDGRTKAVVGTVWKSLAYNLAVKRETEQTVSGRVIRRLMEVYDIQLGTEPPPGRVVIPGDFTVDNATLGRPPVDVFAH